MEITLTDISKKFGKHQIIKNFSYSFGGSSNYIVCGKNGSGKSTLLKLISKWMSPNDGKITWNGADAKKKEELISFVAPYIELPETSTVQEIVSLHFKIRKMLEKQTALFDLPFIKSNKNKTYQDLSSGMKQKLKLILCLFSDAQLYLLDEPSTNLDARGVEDYKEMLKILPEKRILIIASNEEKDYNFLPNYKLIQL